VKGIDIRCQGQGHHIGFQSINDRPRLLARSTMRLIDGYVLPGFFFPMFGEGRIEFRVKFPCGVIGHIEEFDRSCGGERGCHEDSWKNLFHKDGF
jgi:hypothetical protein